MAVPSLPAMPAEEEEEEKAIKLVGKNAGGGEEDAEQKWNSPNRDPTRFPTKGTFFVVVEFLRGKESLGRLAYRRGKGRRGK